MRRLFLALCLLAAVCLNGAIPERWFADKARLGSADRSAVYAALPTRHQPIATLPERLAGAFRERPGDLTVYIGEAYFVDHCLNHHPEVPDDVYRRLQEILDAPDEAILDRRGGKDGLVLAKRLDGTLYVLALRHYPSPQSQIAYKTLFPSDKRPYPNLPRFTLPVTASPIDDLAWGMVSADWGKADASARGGTAGSAWAKPEAKEAPTPDAPLGSRGNPIRCTSVPNAERYLAALRDATGAPVRFRRFALLAGEGNAPVDGWLLRLSDGTDRRLYINPGAFEDTQSAPEGLTLSDFRPVRNEAWLKPLLEDTLRP